MGPNDNAVATGTPTETKQQPAEALAVREPACEAWKTPTAQGPEAALPESELGCRTLFEGHPLPMWAYVPNTLRGLEVNQGAIQQYGFTEQERLGMTIADIRPEEEIPRLLEDVIKRVYGVQKPEVWLHRRKNGETFDAETVCYRLRFQGVEAVMVAANDVTERTRTAELLRNSEMKYRVLFECSADAYWLADEQSILECNPAARQMFGYAPGEAMPHPAGLSPPRQPDGSSSGDRKRTRLN